MTEELKVGHVAYWCNRRNYTAWELGVVEAYREGVTVISCDNPIYDAHSNYFINGRWYDRLDVIGYSEMVRLGFQIIPNPNLPEVK